MGLADIRQFMLETYQIFPLLLLSIFFFLGVLTSNIGMLLTIIGAVLLVPSIVVGSNDLFNAKEIFASFDILSILSYIAIPQIITPVFLKGLGGMIYSTEEENPLLYIGYIVPFLMYGLGFLGRPPLSIINPLVWFKEKSYFEQSKTTQPLCSLLPQSGPNDTIYTGPSYWLSYMLFFFGFLLSNAISLLRIPSPSPPPTTDESQRSRLQEVIDQKVKNRKNIAISTIVLLTLALGFVMVTRFFTYCERGFLNTFFTNLFTIFIGMCWYTILTVQCGVRAADIFGIVTSFVPPEYLKSKIVCTT